MPTTAGVEPEFVADTATAATAPVAPATVLTVSLDDSIFPRPDILTARVAFWRDVFTRYSRYQSVIQSMDAPEKIYTVLDFRDEMARGMDENSVRRLQVKAEARTKKEIDALLKEVDKLQSTPDKLSAEQHTLYALFADSSDPQRFKKAIGRFRAQRGLKEATDNALEVSVNYLPHMEEIFGLQGLPPQLTRLPLVESSFNLDAYSKVGAAGIWQFIPSSARIYMRLNEVVDERRDPWYSTEAAAKHLKKDYEALGSWPLAITAYNHGRDGLLRGLREVKGSTLEDLLQGWDGRRFGFASRNFYAEFLAAMDVERDYRKARGALAARGPLEFDVVETQHYLPYEALLRCTGTDVTTFRRLNPAYQPDVIEGRLYVPPSRAIRVPAGTVEKFRTAYTALTAGEKFDQQRFYYVQYRVQNGDSLDRIARRYGISVASLRQANAFANPHRLRAGQFVRIPPRAAARLVKASYNSPADTRGTDAATGVSYLVHHVRPGDALITIARHYKTTVDALRQLNNLGSSSSIQVGATLKVPNP